MGIYTHKKDANIIFFPKRTKTRGNFPLVFYGYFLGAWAASINELLVLWHLEHA